MGSFGSGQTQPRDPTVERAVPWELPQGDKTYVQLAKPADEEQESRGAKFQGGTLFAVLRSLEQKGKFDIQLSTFGQAVPLSEGNLRKYSFVPKEGGVSHFDYVLKSQKAEPAAGGGAPKTTQGNVFAAGWSRGGVGGAVLLVSCHSLWALEGTP